jgi:hypothetical protein
MLASSWIQWITLTCNSFCLKMYIVGLDHSSMLWMDAETLLSLTCGVTEALGTLQID